MENQSRINVSLAYAGKTGVWFELGKDPVTVSKWVHQHHTTRFADAGKDFRNIASEYQRNAR